MDRESKVMCPWYDKGEIYVEGAGKVVVLVKCPRCKLRNLIIVNTVASSMYTDPEELAVRAKLAEQLKFGIIVVSAAPLMIVYPFVQKYFAIGVTVGAVKG